MDEDPTLSLPLSVAAIALDSPAKTPLGLETALADADSDRIGGFVWKFPSEGSNARVGGPEPAAAAAPYPRKCRYCARAWVSSYVSERRHWQTCRPADQAETQAEAATSLGAARRVWCEVDAALTGIQWRDDVDEPQDVAACRVAFHEIAEVALLASPRTSFQITTTSGRRIVLQCRDESVGDEPQDEAAAPRAATTRALDARQWVEYLEMFSRFAQQRRALDTVCEETTEEPNQSVMDSTEDANEPDAELLREALQLVQAGDADALDEMLTDADVGPVARVLCDANGSSLLVQAIKLDADARVVKTLLRAGVDANAKNHEGESPLLLAAASGDLALLGLLLRTPTVRVNQRCALGATAFHAAANAGDVAALRAMCEHGEVAATLVDENGWTALHYAAACVAGREAMQFLCELLPELVDARCIQGNTALHVAAGYGCEPTLRVLLQTAANPHVANAEGHSAYHVALHNHHIACAIAVNEYMETPRETYERAVTAAALPSAYSSVSHAKEDRVAPAETTSQAFYTSVDGEYYDYYGSAAPSAWTEYYTEDQIPYYYNTLTGESTWHMPEPLKEPSCLAAAPPPPPPPQSWPLSDEISDNATEPGGDERRGHGHSHGQQLPLCMIPLVSPLVSLDDPTAATKLDSRRKRDRERRRRSKELRLRGGEPSHSTSHASEMQLPPPPPPPQEYSLTLTRARRTHSRRALFEVQ